MVSKLPIIWKQTVVDTTAAMAGYRYKQEERAWGEHDNLYAGEQGEEFVFGSEDEATDPWLAEAYRQAAAISAQAAALHEQEQQAGTVAASAMHHAGHTTINNPPGAIAGAPPLNPSPAGGHN